jgi:TM2 domain-containing membrane protein YozV
MWEAIGLNREEIRQDEEKLRATVRDLPDEDRARYHREFQRRYRDPDTFAVLNWFFMAGLHHFYLGRVLRGAVNLLLMTTGLVSLAVLPPLGILLIAAVVVIELPALFRSQVIVADHNVDTGWEILESLDEAS